MSRRTEMLGRTIQKELGMMILQLKDPRITGMPSVTRVKLSSDLSIADVFVTIMGAPGAQTAALNALRHSAALLRGKLTKILSLRTVPYLKFQMDESLKREIEVLDLLRKVAQEREELERQRAGQAPAESETHAPHPAPDDVPAARRDAGDSEGATDAPSPMAPD